MSKYTMELRNVCTIYGRDTVESWFKSYNLTDYLTADEIAIINNTNIWNKDKLAKNIVDYYYMREIGFETVALFRHYVINRMDIIMEKYAPLIYSKSLNYDPLINTKYTESFERGINRNSTQNGTSTNNSNGINITSDTPQGQVDKTDILNGKYASGTNAGESTSTNTDSLHTESNDGETYKKTIEGNTGTIVTSQKLIQQYRDIIININNDIIKELSTLFMGIY